MKPKTRTSPKAAATKKLSKKGKPVAKRAASPKVIKLRCELCKKAVPATELKIDKLKNKAYCESCVEQFDIKGCKPRTMPCEAPGCKKTFDIRSHNKFVPGTIRLACPDCYEKYKDIERRKDKVETTDFAWYVVSFEQGKGGKVRTGIRKTLKTLGLERHLGRMFQPTHLVEKLVPVYGDIVAEGESKGPNDARADIKTAMWKLEDENPDKVFKDSMHEDQKTGRWKWRIRVDLQENVLKVRKAAKFPGYALVQLKWDERVKAAIEKVRYCWGVLLKPVVQLKFNMTVAESKKFGWRWRVRHPNTNMTIATGTVPWTEAKGKGREVEKTNEDRKERAKDLAREKARMVVAELRGKAAPVSLEAAEAVLLLSAQKAVDEISKDKEELNRPVVNFKVGDEVVIKRGVWTGQVARVAIIDKDIRDSEGNRVPEAQVLVTLAPVVFGKTHPTITLSLKHHELSKKEVSK